MNDYRIKPGKKVRLKDWNASERGRFQHSEDSVDPIKKNLEKLDKLQELLYAEARHAVLIVLQGMDTSGKDGAIEHVFSGVNPQGCAVTSFKVPSARELSHDYLWRIHQATPSRGMIGIFNRSHYESVLVERVHKLVPKDVWKKRYDHINQFERLLADEGTLILKFFLHISKDEQRERLEKRLADKKKHWKFSLNDVAERKFWPDYHAAYEDALEKCSTDWAPWHIVPANHKWFRNWVISSTIVDALEKLNMKFPPPAKGIENVKVI